MNRRSFHIRAAALLAATAAGPAFAAWPEKPIEAIVPWPAGQELDILARTMVPVLSRQLGVPMAVINRPGGGGVVGTAEAMRAKPDGHTILFNSIGPMLTQPLAGNAPYKVTDAEPIGIFNASTFVVIVRGDSPFKTIQDLEAHAKKSDKPLVLGHFGPAAVPTQVIYRMASQNKWRFRGVTFSPASPAQLKSGDADFVTAPYNTARSAIAAGDVRAILTFNPTRLHELPDVPTLREAGYNFDVLVWQALFVPKGTPADIRDKLAAAMQVALKDPSVLELAKKINTPLFWKNAEETAAQIRADEAGLTPVMTELGLIKKAGGAQ
ncbi:tripartite tricarboxylate transporter substrate binding protein [Ramlibacter tataouinensis]|uniref:tripartite tricarboxylate transporter substrate binding protein n=1 Tax=Ramlibacter tataouinensis TaxID=94132 RepID=UPI0022F40191|nr:tripartite tricarboxylate transporter substrate binding protein [Ramlibacter tataouinensis]WBY00256.1 tripartite tricarboxylate transporter substrate binding protein [Ramlibacter tataouinensis]